MRARLANKQVVTVRAVNSSGTGMSGDEFGDAPIVTATTRSTGFQLPVQVMWVNTTVGNPGNPGRDPNLTAVGRILKRDVPSDAPSGWEPKQSDMFTLISGQSLFVTDARPAFPKSPRLGKPVGGWDGWEVTLSDKSPTMRAADQY